MTRRKNVVEVHLVEPTMGDRERDCEAIGGTPSMDTHPLLVQRYQHLPEQSHLGGPNATDSTVRNPSNTADQSFPANISPPPVAVAGPSSSKELFAPSIAIPVSPVTNRSGGPRGQKRDRDYEIVMKSSSTPSRYPKNSSSFDEISVGRSGRSEHDQAFERIKSKIGPRFDRRFVEFRTEHNREFKAAVKLVKGDTENPGVFDKYVEAVRGTGRRTGKDMCEDMSSFLLADALDEIAHKLQPGKKNESYFASRGGSIPSDHPKLNFALGHKVQGTNDYWHSIRPDMIIRKNRSDNVDCAKVGTMKDQTASEEQDYNWGKFAAVGEIKKDRTSDMRTIGTTMQASLAQVMNYMGFLAYENPVTGQTCGVTACGGYMRAVLNDSLSCSTTRLCDLGNPKHAEDIVAMIAFLIGPLHAVLSTYEIPTGEFAVESGEGKEKTLSKYKWVSDSEGVKWKILERRHDLHGRRTVTIHGKARKVEKGAPTESLVIKFTWLPRYLAHYEQLILRKLARAAKEAEEPENNPKLAEAMKAVPEEIIEYRPRSIGMLADCERTTRESPVRGSINDGLAHSSSELPSQLVLSGMCTVNPVGMRISTLSSLSWKQRLQILSGAFASLWVAACSDVHYRDVNIGNVLYALLDEQSGEVIGYLIDYGNARVLNQRRLATRFDGATLEQIREYFPDSVANRIHAKTDDGTEDFRLQVDDALSTNRYFISTHLAEVLMKQDIWEGLLVDKRLKDRAYELDPESDEARENAHQAKVLLDEETQELWNLRNHRYTDDMESLVFGHIYQIAELIGEVEPKRRNHSIFSFDVPEVKKAAWHDNLRYTLQSLLSPDSRWRVYLTTIVKEIKKARTSIDAAKKVPASITDWEHECFRECLEILKQAQADPLLSDKPVTRPKAKLPEAKRPKG